MRVLLLGRCAHYVEDVIAADAEVVHAPRLSSSSEAIALYREVSPNLTVLFGFDHLLPVSELQRRPLNIHTSYLPWCRGPAPHLWSVLEGVPLGTTIFEIDSGIDTGPILAQRTSDIDLRAHTLNSFFEAACEQAAKLFTDNWEVIRNNQYKCTPQEGAGSSHNMKMQGPFHQFLLDNLDAPLDWLAETIRTQWPEIFSERTLSE